MNSFPLVSICIPAFNVEKYIAETLKCLIQQTYSNLEIIVVDDNSTDRTFEIIQVYSKKDLRIKAYLKKNEGAASARNFAFNKSSGEYIKFFDADDLLSKSSIQKQVELLQNNPDGIISGRWGRFYKNDITTFKLNPEECWKNMNPIDWICSSWRNAGSMTQPGIFLIPRSLICLKGLWNESLSLMDDLEFYTRIILGSTKVIYCPSSILLYRSGNFNNLSGQKSRKAYESAYLSIELGVKAILAIENSERTRKACANYFQEWGYQFYPQEMDLYRKSKGWVNKLGGSDYPFPAGGITLKLTTVLGWKMTKRLKILLK